MKNIKTSNKQADTRVDEKNQRELQTNMKRKDEIRWGFVPSWKARKVLTLNGGDSKIVVPPWRKPYPLLTPA